MKPHIFLISGWAHDSAELQPLARRLAGEWDCSVFNAADLIDPQPHFDALDANVPVVIVGWSLGGMRAMQVASSPRVIGLVLISSMRRFTVSSDFPAGTPAANMRAMSLGIRRKPKQTLLAFYAQCASPHLMEQAKSEQRAERIINADSVDLQNGLTYLAQADLGETIDALTVPTWILHGREDAVVSLAASLDLHARMPASQRIVKNDIGHDLPLRAPDWVVENIMTFLTEHVDF